MGLESIWNMLLTKGADTNIVYPEDSHKDTKNGIVIPKLQGAKRTSKRDSAATEVDANAEAPYHCTIMINYIQHGALKEDSMLESFRTLVKYGAHFAPCDSNGLSVLDHAIIKNNEALVQFILANKEKGVMIDQRLPNGCTAVHTVVKPLGFGSFENIKILGMLYEHGYDLTA